jgi:hypothetical protein
MRGILILFLSIIVPACSSVPTLTEAEREALHSRAFVEASYEGVFRGYKTILLDEGYVIKVEDIQAGLIVAVMNKGSHIVQGTSPGDVFLAEGYELSVNIERSGPAEVSSRVSVQRMENYSLGGQRGVEIVDTSLYETLYQRVKEEMQSRRAEGSR